MRHVDRRDIPAPSYLSSREARLIRQSFLAFLQLSGAERAQTRVPDRHLPNDASLRDALDALFAGKCAFCESRVKTSVYRFRPTSDAEPADRTDPMAHLTYGWLADAWQNLYPICVGCRPKRPHYFPINGPRRSLPSVEYYQAYVEADNGLWRDYPLNEGALLLDPCGRKNPRDHLQPSIDGRLAPISVSGHETIQQFNLNRSDLVARRKAAFARYNAGDADGSDFRAEFAGLWKLFQQQREVAAAAESPAVAIPPSPAPEVANLSKVSLRNFKGIERLELAVPDVDPTIEDQGRALLILGENAAGKSSILEAIALAMLDEAALQALKPDVLDYLLNPRFMGATEIAQRQEGSVVLSFDNGTTRVLTLKSKTLPGAPVPGFKFDPSPPSQPVFAYGAYRHYLKDRREWSPDRPVVSLFRSDNLLANPEAWLLSLSTDQFNMVVQALKDIFGSVATFNVLDRDDKECVVVTDLGNDRRGRTPLSSVSSGFRTILALACDVMHWTMTQPLGGAFTSLTSARGIVLIDEVEAHLHPRWKLHIMTGLRRALPGMTFIATTHDPLCLRAMGQHEVLVLHRSAGTDAGSVLPVSVDTFGRLPDVSKLTVEQLLTSDLFSLLSTEDTSMESDMAALGDYLRGTPEQRSAHPDGERLEALRVEMSATLPIGMGEGGRMVQEAVAQYLLKRRDANPDGRLALSDETKAFILAQLEGI